ncbi:hypothetical protein [Aliarcobacter butzleri]|uniref:hypothetical protein n=1 Tax=Aliarcobacter butzleri TaxID=28197 RepID=UPI0021B4B613|nr:hypothetical protein [Aliarcobacter butzleri]MCT7626113.1 hypothetical protein [Aliarcobacter butzleri]MCT7644168.1 hypothetical protein [Aliarcobacter butzleri]
MKKIIYIFFGVLSKNLYDALNINYFIQNDIEVELVDVTSLFFNYKNNQIFEKIICISSYKELEEYFCNNDNSDTLYNVQFHYETKFVKFFLLLKKYNCKISIFEIGYLPSPNTEEKIIKYLQQPLKLFKRIICKISDKLLIKFNLINLNYDIRFVSGSIPLQIVNYNSKKIVELNYIDYEYDRDKVSTFKNEKKYFVFLDIYLHKHQDHTFADIGNINKFSGEKYLKNLNNFFDKIEKRFNVEVIIAAHPKSSYSQNEFKNRKIIKDDTVNLVRNSHAVISHHSTSISYAVLNKKPIIFIFDNSIKNNFKNVYMFTKIFADYLQMPFLNIDLEEIEIIPNVCELKYDNYKYNFLTTKNAEQFTNKQIIEGFIKSEMVF